jgi:hypothetical protein
MEKLCLNKGISVTAAVIAMSMSKSNLGYWKTVSTVTNQTKKKISDFFEIPVQELEKLIKRDVVEEASKNLPTKGIVEQTWNNTFGKEPPKKDSKILYIEGDTEMVITPEEKLLIANLRKAGDECRRSVELLVDGYLKRTSREGQVI